MKINEVIIVEGHHDASRLKQFFDVECIVTNGSAINKDTLNLIVEVAKVKDIIIFCDPDYPGEKIRSKIIKAVPNAKHAYILKDKAIDYQKNKVGVEHASFIDLKESLSNVITFKEGSTLSWTEYLSLPCANDKIIRFQFCEQLKIAPCNNKTLYKRLNMMEYDLASLTKIIKEF